MFAFAVVVLAASAYVVAYVSLGERTDWRLVPDAGQYVERHFPGREWCLTLFAPAAAVESKWIGCPVYLIYARPPVQFGSDLIDGTFIDDSAPAQ
jgi:hypothetical protein